MVFPARSVSSFPENNLAEVTGHGGYSLRGHLVAQTVLITRALPFPEIIWLPHATSCGDSVPEGVK